MEDLNQNLETENLFDEEVKDEEESLFDEETEEEEAAEETEDTESKPGEESEEETAEEEDNEPFMTIRYNKADKGLTKEEAVVLAQKGLNYDHVNGAYNDLLGKVEHLAKMNEMTVQEYLQSMEEMQMNYAVARELDALKEQYPDTGEEILQEVAMNRVKERNAQTQTQVAHQSQMEADARKNEISRQLDIFEKNYPNERADQLDPMVYDLMKEGYTLMEAYSVYLIQKDAKEQQRANDHQKISALNQKNKKRSIGNTNTNDDVMADDFMKGFLG